MPRDASGNPRSGFARAGHADKVMAERSSKPEAKPAMEKPKAGAEHGKGTDVSHMGIEEVVKAHGPAHGMQSVHKGDLHTVTSHHGEHMHHSEHGSKEEAHAHIGKAMGLGQEGDAYSGEESPMEEAAEQRHPIPGMA